MDFVVSVFADILMPNTARPPAGTVLSTGYTGFIHALLIGDIKQYFLDT